MRAALATALLPFLAALDCCAQSVVEGRGLATVRFRAVSPFGEPMSRPPDVDGFKDESGRDWSSRFKDGSAGGIPYGTYEVSAYVGADYTEYSRRISVHAPVVLVNAAFGISAMEVGGPVIATVRGRVTGLPSSREEAWCKLSGVYLANEYETVLLRDGSFDFGLVETGSYIAVCGLGSQLRLLKAVRVEGGIGSMTLEAKIPKTN